MKETIKCSVCGAEIKIGETGAEFRGEYYCHNCLEVKTVICECCNIRILRDNAVDDRVCHDCYVDHYCRCQECGALVHEDDAQYIGDDPYCDRCYDDCHHEFIEDYSYKPDPIFYGIGQPHYGIELEIDDGGETDDNARQIMDIVNYPKEHIYCKHDGSLNIASQDTSLNRRIQGIECDISDINKQINNIVNVVAQTGSTALTDKLRELEREKTEKSYVLSSLQEQLHSEKIDDNSLKQAFQKAKNMLKNGNLATQKLIVNTYVNCVKLYPDKIEIIFNLMPNYTVKDILSKEKISA